MAIELNESDYLTFEYIDFEATPVDDACLVVRVTICSDGDVDDYQAFFSDGDGRQISEAKAKRDVDECGSSIMDALMAAEIAGQEVLERAAAEEAEIQ